jgi:hypothetical protein
MDKSKNGLYAGIAVAVVAVIAIIVGLVIANNNKNAGNGEIEEPETSEVVSTFDSVDETVEFGDYDAMQTLAKDIQNGDAIGKIVQIEGLVSHPMSKYSIVEENADGTSKIGTEFVIEGMDEADYPEDGTRIVITGAVIEKEPLYYVIQTTADYVIILDEADQTVDVEESEVVEE